jgi:hypothetical protein
MLRLSLAVAISTICLLNSASAQRYRDTSGDALNAEKAINQSATNAEVQLGVEQGITQGTHRVPNSAPDQHGNHWRYRFQNSQWWYYQPNNLWVVWNGNSWVQPSAALAHGSQANQPQQHQSGYRGVQGMNQQPAPEVAPVPQPQSARAAQPQRAMSRQPTSSAPQGATKPAVSPIEKQPKGVTPQPEGQSVGSGTSTLPGTPARDTTTPSGSVQ